jgi:hypothetical protein
MSSLSVRRYSTLSTFDMLEAEPSLSGRSPDGLGVLNAPEARSSPLIVPAPAIM